MDMPTKKRTVAAQAAARGPLPEMPPELIEQLVQRPMSASEVQDLFLSFQKAVIERMMNAEMSQHLGYKPGEGKPEGQTNERNGASPKTALTDNVLSKSVRRAFDWKIAMNQFAILYGEQFTLAKS